MMRIFAVYFVFLSIIMAGCTSNNTEPLSINEEGLELQDEERKDLEHKRNIEELELQQSELLEGLLEEDSFAESLSEVTDDTEQDINVEADTDADEIDEMEKQLQSFEKLDRKTQHNLNKRQPYQPSLF